MCQPKEFKSPRHATSERNCLWDVAFFLLPAAFFGITPIFPIYLTAVLRMLSTHLILGTHYAFVDKENYTDKISQAQMQREKKDYLVGIILHMWAQLVLQILFPRMFFTESDVIFNCALNSFITHVAVVEPLYYAVHRWLHFPEHMKSMHGFHHSSVKTLPSTSLVQNFQEHFIYIATFGPAMLLPYFVTGTQHWSVILVYLVLFDVMNAYGHTNIKCRHWIWESKWSPMHYLFYTPEFHLGHHALFTCNYGLFMPFWDHLFGTYREYKKPDQKLAPEKQQDFVFIGHNGGLGHFLTIPEISFYNIYDEYNLTGMPILLELTIMKALMDFFRLVLRSYKLPRYLVDGKHVGRIICIMRSPLDYFRKSKKTFEAMNLEMLKLIRDEYDECGTRYFGLGNLNKMKQLNDGGIEIARLIEEDEYLKDKKIRIWTGDTLTTASIYHQMLEIKDLDKVFYIGANGKIGNAICRMLVERGVHIRIFSKHAAIVHDNVTYTQDITDMQQYKYCLIGKLVSPKVYKKVLQNTGPYANRYMLDYTVPFMPLKTGKGVHHLQIGVLKVTNDKFLKGYYETGFGIGQNHIYPCHAGCILNMVTKRETNETGEIKLEEVSPAWKVATSHGLANRAISFA